MAYFRAKLTEHSPQSYSIKEVNEIIDNIKEHLLILI